MGPYLGTFTETGTGTVDLGTLRLSTFSTCFTIHCGAGTFTGTGSGSGGTGCQDPLCDTGGSLSGSPCQATISSPMRSCTDQGTADIAFVTESSVPPILFGEGLSSARTQPALISPTSKDQ
jgi:hypothetical protein